MKKSLLLFFLLFSLGMANAQLAMKDGCTSCPKEQLNYQKTDIKVYPNPATDYIAFQNPLGQVKKVVIYNLVGRSIKKLDATTGKNMYDVTDLSRGMYLVQLMDSNAKVITTKRINKR